MTDGGEWQTGSNGDSDDNNGSSSGSGERRSGGRREEAQCSSRSSGGTSPSPHASHASRTRGIYHSDIT